MNELVRQAVTPSKLMSTDDLRTIEEVKAAIMVAQKINRNELIAETGITAACKRLALAEKAMYSYSKGGQQISGPSIHLAKMMARYWGNLQYGVRELEVRDKESVVEPYCWDMQTNTRSSKVIIVKHQFKAHGKMKELTDPRDIYEHVANMAARRLRMCILDVLPAELIEMAQSECQRTLEHGEGVSVLDRVKKMIVSFTELGVDREMIETRLGHKLEITTAIELVNLQKIFVSLRDGMSKREDWFKFESAESKNLEIEMREKLVKDGEKMKN